MSKQPNNKKHVRKRRKQSKSKKERHKHTRKLNASGHSLPALKADIADFVMGGGAGGGVTSESEVDESAEAAKVIGWTEVGPQFCEITWLAPEVTS